MEEMFFYCQDCDAKITLDQLGLLNEGKCPTCGSNIGFSSAPRDKNDGFEEAVVLNDTDFLENEF
jgi:transcription initiation factor IIE alpha subunit